MYCTLLIKIHNQGKVIRKRKEKKMCLTILLNVHLDKDKLRQSGERNHKLNA